MKHLKILLTTIAALLCSATINAYNFEVDGIYYNITSSKDLTVSVTYRNNSFTSSDYKYKGNVIVPESIIYRGNTYSVTSIGEDAFYYCKSLTSITIPSSVTSIGESAFSNSSLESITIPSSVTSIGKSAFSNSSLESINIPGSVTSIGKYAFYECSSLASITIPNNVTSIGEYAFHNTAWYDSQPDGIVYAGHVLYQYKGTMPKNTSITVKEGTVGIAGSAFFSCHNLNSITIPNSVTCIEKNAFMDCGGLTTINIEKDNTIYDSRDNCNAIIETSTNKLHIGCKASIIPKTVTSIGDYAFYSCTSLTSITIPNSITSIGEEAFKLCTNLGIVFNESNLYIRKYSSAYGYIAYYASRVISDFTFENISGINTLVECKKTKEKKELGNWHSTNKSNDSTSSQTYSFNVDEGYLLFFDWEVSSEEDYDKLIINLDGKEIINKSGTLSGYYEKSFNESGTHTLIVKYSKDHTRSDNEDMATVSNIFIIKRENFENKVVLPKGWNGNTYKIGDEVFYNNKGLTEIIIPDSVIGIGNNTFEGCSALTSITISNSVTSVGESAFSGCTNLKAVNISNISTWYMIKFSNEESNPLYGLSHLYINGKELRELIIPNNIITINEYAFCGCLSLVSVTIPSSVTNIGKYAFKNCSNLTYVKVGYGTPISLSIGETFSNRMNSTLCVPIGHKEIYENSNVWKDFKEIIEYTTSTISINQHGSRTYCSEHAFDFTNVEGLKAYVAGGYNTETQKVLMVNVKTTKPSTGLLLKGEPGEYVVPLLESSKDNYLNLLVGTSSKVIVNEMSDDGKYYNYKYTITSDDPTPKFHKFMDGSTLSSNKAYLQIPVDWFDNPSEAKAVNIVFEDEETTDIKEFKSLGNTKTGIMCDLQGRRVANPTKGLYIVNGKKVLVK